MNTEAQVPTRKIAGVDITTFQKREVVRFLIEESNRAKEGFHVHLVNAFTIVCASDDKELNAALSQSGLNIPDGKPLAWITKWSRNPVTHFRGPDLFREVLSAGVPNGLRHFFLGGTEETLTSLIKRVENLIPSVKVVGSYSPQFNLRSTEDFENERNAILQASPDIIWVGLGTPKQDLAAVELALEHPAVVICVGAAFDFLAGSKKEAPIVFRKLGLEWLFRLLQEPGRLWKRYLIGNLKFVWIVLSRKGN